MATPPTPSCRAALAGRPTPALTPGAGLQTCVRISSAQLFCGAQEVQIEHQGLLYRLRQTSLGKLILTK